ncbi:MAG: PAS domain S-box protein, partial [Pseudomonadota bacterium]
MVDKFMSDFDGPPETSPRPKLFELPDTATETIDLAGLFQDAPPAHDTLELKGVEHTAFGKLLRALPLPAMLINKHHKVTLVNESCMRISPNHQDIVGRNFHSLFPNRSDSEKAQALIDNVLKVRKSKVMEGLLQVDEDKIWARTNLRSIKLGTERGILVLIEDLTVEKKQILLYEKYRRLVNIFPLGIAEFSFSEPISPNLPLTERFKRVVKARLVHGNNEFALLHGHKSVDRLRGTRLDAFYPLNEQTKALILKWIKSDMQIHANETSSITADGEERYYEDTLIGTTRGDSLVGFWSLKKDITERKRSEEELYRINEFQRQLLSTAATGIFTVNSSGTISDVNDEFCRMTGYEPEEIKGRQCRLVCRCSVGEICNIFHEDHPERVVREQVSLRAKDGRIMTVLKNANLLRDDEGRRVGAIESFVDVSELIEARNAAEEASRAKSSFLATVSHEIRTPLNGIIANADLALSTELSPEQRDYLSTMKHSGLSLLALINDILEYSAGEAGQIHLERAVFSLRDSLEALMRTMAVDAHSKGLELAYRVSPSVPDILVGDARRLKQILINLIGNAVKFTSLGEVVLLVQLQSISEDDVSVLFAVTDTGMGIPREKHHEIFEAFRQVDGSLARRHGGTGLGLAISARLVEQMNGQIWVESDLDKGSTFHFTVLFQKGEGLVAKWRSRKNEPDVMDRAALIIDDSVTSLSITEELLSSWGMAVETASGGNKGLDTARKALTEGHPFDIVLVDAEMPDMDGYQIAAELQGLS